MSLVDDLFGTEQLAAAVLRAARGHITDMQARGGLPEGMNPETAVRLQAIAMLRSAAFVIENAADDEDDDDAGSDDRDDSDDSEAEHGDDDE
ncbi:MAG: hypothetical protein ACREN2_02225 [Candidatus Dormibacteria bacterium]